MCTIARTRYRSETFHDILQFSPVTLQSRLVDGSPQLADLSGAWSKVQGVERSPSVDTDEIMMVSVVLINISYLTLPVNCSLVKIIQLCNKRYDALLHKTVLGKGK